VVEDLEHIVQLADGRWMATSCPIFGLNLDPVFLKHLDMDGNGRIISDEVRAAIQWFFKCLQPSETWLKREPNLMLKLIKTDNPEGKALDSAARRVHVNLKIENAEFISLEQVRSRQKIMAQADYNGDGIIPPEVIKTPEVAQFARDLILIFGGTDDASGSKGISEEILNKFKQEATAYLQWQIQGVIPEGQTKTPIMPFGGSTPGMFNVLSSVRDKIEQFFAQCALVRFNVEMLDRITASKDELTELNYRDTQAIIEHLRGEPISRPNRRGILPLDEGVNHVYTKSIEAFKKQVVTPILGENNTKLTEEQWRQILKQFEAYEKWFKSKPSTAAESLGMEKIRVYLESSYDADIRQLIAADKAVAGEIQQLQNLEKLILYHQLLFEFVNNYVSFPHLFHVEERAMFEMGTLVLDGSDFTFSIKVENRNIHSNIAKNSGIHLIYLQISGSKPEDNYEIAVPVTRGKAKNFYVGKRGVFHAVSGKELDAQIIQIVENPISLLDSIKEPFRKVYGMIGGRLTQITSSIQKESEKTITGATTDQQTIQSEFKRVQDVPQSSATPPPQTPQSPSGAGVETPRSGNARDLMIGIGLLVAGLGTALKFIVDAARQLTQPKTLYVLLIMIGVFIAISVLSVIVSAWLKLRQRDLGILLQASGWAINGRMRLIRPMAWFFTRKVRIPKGSKKHHKELLKPLEKIARKKED
jgi:hypothetical protein